MSLSLRDAHHIAAQELKKAGVSEPSLDARLLLASLFKDGREVFFREPERLLTSEEEQLFRGLVERRVLREPVSHILGRREFWSLEFLVNSDVLDPRPDSETLIEATLTQCGQEFSGRILDLGTGSGCLLLTLLTELPKSTGIAVDQSVAALDVAKENTRRLGLQNRCELFHSHWFEKVQGRFDVIVSNPPYIETETVKELEPEVTQFEPLSALDGGKDGLNCYREIVSSAPDFLCEGGYLIFEVGFGQAEAVASLLRGENFSEIRIHNDLASVGRCVSGILK
ncbi:MAG: peptide chain release factor N(5)-glutamine methyltransferase [Sneathiellales bacterium]|nr:peptide chain release factor N(5)-glutamine methyltransferase [Sneathiellales bacterium]